MGRACGCARPADELVKEGCGGAPGTSGAKDEVPPVGGWWAGRDSNPRPRRPVEALPLELRSPWWGAPGLEPGTFHFACALPLSYQPKNWEPRGVGLPCLLHCGCARVRRRGLALVSRSESPGRSRGTAGGGWWALRGLNPPAAVWPKWARPGRSHRAFPVRPRCAPAGHWRGSNPRRRPGEGAALPTELHDHGHRTFGIAVRGGPRFCGTSPGRESRVRTCDRRFWKPLLFQLSYLSMGPLFSPVLPGWHRGKPGGA